MGLFDGWNVQEDTGIKYAKKGIFYKALDNGYFLISP